MHADTSTHATTKLRPVASRLWTRVHTVRRLQSSVFATRYIFAPFFFSCTVDFFGWMRYLLRCVALHCVTLHCVTLRYIALRYVTLRYVTLHYVTLRYVTLRCVVLCCVPPQGHNLPDGQGNRYCINLVSIAGNPVSDSDE